MNRETHLDKTVQEEHDNRVTRVKVRSPGETERLVRLVNHLDHRKYFGYDYKGKIYRVIATSQIEAMEPGRMAARVSTYLPPVG